MTQYCTRAMLNEVDRISCSVESPAVVELLVEASRASYTGLGMSSEGESSKSYPVAQVGVCAVGLVEPVLPLHHHAQVLVVEDEGLDLQLLDLGGGQLLAVHQEAAVPVDVHHHLQRKAIEEKGGIE